MSIFNPIAALDYCEKEVRSKDIGSYIHGLFLPKEIRPFFYTAHALRLELVQSREMIRNASLMSTKLDWWIENLDFIWSNSPPNEPISIAVNELRKHHVVRKSHFERLIRGSFEEEVIKNWRLFDKFIDNNYTMVYYITLELFGLLKEKEFEAATYAGRAWGISQHLLRTKYYADHNRFYFPEEILTKYKVPLNFTSENENHENLLPESFYDIILETAAYGKQNLSKLREIQSTLPRISYLVFLQMTQAEYFYNRLEKYNFNLFNQKSRKTSWPVVAYRMAKCAKRGFV